MSVIDKFLHYVSFDTQSDEHSTTTPSTLKQLVLAQELVKELKEIGVSNAALDPNGIVYGEIEANAAGDAIGLIAHMDTASEMPGKDVRPRIVEHYDGGNIQLNEQYAMDADAFPELQAVIGDDIIVTDGNTLLGADDKAGIAIIMEAIEGIIKSNSPHGKIMIAFTPDEEVGRGTENFDLDRFKVDYAYTLDGSEIQNVDYQTFNAASAVINISGRAIHPGSAKGQMINATAVAVDFASRLPQWERPEFTEGEEGFFHLLEMSGECDHAHLAYIIRDHNRQRFEEKKQLMKKIAETVNCLYNNCLTLEIRDQYYNLADAMNGDTRAVERAKDSLKACGIEPDSLPIRGGTDGAMLTWKGLITPNLGTGGGNFHGRYEFVSINKMNKMVEVVTDMLKAKSAGK